MSPKHGSINAQMLNDLTAAIRMYVHEMAKAHPMDPTYRKIIVEEVADHLEKVATNVREDG